MERVQLHAAGISQDAPEFITRLRLTFFSLKISHLLSSITAFIFNLVV